MKYKLGVMKSTNVVERHSNVVWRDDFDIVQQLSQISTSFELGRVDGSD